MSDARDDKRPSVVATIKRLPRLLWRLARDPRVPWTVKAALVGMGLYLATPIDLIPDWIPGLGYLDDVLLVGAVVGYVLRKVPRDVVREHWGEDVEVLEGLGRRKRDR